MENKIVEKIRKCLALAENNTNEAEATSAALMAQRLMAENDISMAEVQDAQEEKESVGYASVETGTGRSWKIMLANIVADNFRCKCFIKNKRTICFYGKQTDTLIAKEVFEFLFKTGHRLADRLIHRLYKDGAETRGIYNSFTLGFASGVNKKLSEQCLELMIIISKEVEEQYEDYKRELKMKTVTKNHKIYNSEVYKQGVVEGEKAVESRRKDN